VFTARYALSPYIKHSTVFKGLIRPSLKGTLCSTLCRQALANEVVLQPQKGSNKKKHIHLLLRRREKQLQWKQPLNRITTRSELEFGANKFVSSTHTNPTRHHTWKKSLPHKWIHQINLKSQPYENKGYFSVRISYKKKTTSRISQRHIDEEKRMSSQFFKWRQEDGVVAYLVLVWFMTQDCVSTVCEYTKEHTELTETAHNFVLFCYLHLEAKEGQTNSVNR
jgi:hypothetical protein